MTRKNERFKVSKNFLLFSLAIIVLFKPSSVSYISSMSSINLIWELLRSLLFGASIALYFIGKIKHHYANNRLFVCIIAFYFVELITTIWYSGTTSETLYQGSIYEVLTIAFKGIGLYVAFRLMLQKDYYRALKASAFVFSVYAIINFILTLIYPSGYYTINGYRGYFLGDKNTLIVFLMLSAVFSLVSAQMKKGKFTLWSILILVICLISEVIAESYTSVYAFLILVVGVILIKTRILFKKPFLKMFSTALTVCMIVVYFGSSDTIGNLMEHFTSRSITFFSRYEIWNNTFNLIRDHLLFGNGYISPNLLLSLIGGSHAHNYYLESLLSGGIVLLAILLFMFYLSFGKADEKCSSQFDGVRYILVFAMLAIMISCIFEAYILFRQFYAIFCLAEITLNAIGNENTDY